MLKPPTGCLKTERGTSRPQIWRLWGTWAQANLIAHPWVPISSPVARRTYGPSRTMFELLSWLQKRFSRPSDSDTMTNTAPEATTSSNGKNGVKQVTIQVL